MTDTYIGDLPDGGLIQETDDIPFERAAANYRGKVGTAARKAASDASKDALASVSGATVAGHIAVFTDAAGTVADGGTPDGAIVNATALTLPVLTTDLTVVVRGGQVYLVAVSDFLAAEDPNAGGQFDFSNPINSALAA